MELNKIRKWRHDCVEKIKYKNRHEVRRAQRYDELIVGDRRVMVALEDLEARAKRHNEMLIAKKVETARELIGAVEGIDLDDQQMTCIVKEPRNHLVLAGAGTGKTTTIVGKIKYLLYTRKYNPEDILALSFTNASAAEMRERIKNETKVELEASTFHKLGLNIIKCVEGKVPKITTISLSKLIRDELTKNLEDEEYLEKFTDYLLYNRVIAKNEFEFQTQQEYEEYLEYNPPMTIKNEAVKSYGEMDIANFLFQNSVDYQYEAEYKIDTRTTEFGQYHPDFYLPEYDIYIEYYGISREGKVPKYFSSRAGDASREYRKGMEWKRELHKNNGTKLIELYAYDKYEGNLLQKLSEALEDNGVELKPKSAEMLWGVVAGDASKTEELIELFGTVINLAKSNSYDMRALRDLDAAYGSQNRLLLDLVEPIYETYVAVLADRCEIDFNDMIILATKYVREGKYKCPYKYVIVDEYQDMSNARFALLKALRDTYDFGLFCVGDDWQSIYRFAGSDIGFILDFEKYWGETEISKIETTYRSVQGLIDVAGEFVMKNPNQICKELKSKKTDVGFSVGEVNGYNESCMVRFMTERLDLLPENASVFFLGRYSSDVKMIQSSECLKVAYDNKAQKVKVEYQRRPDLKMEFLTVHKSKGLQADFVFILNNKKSRMGFPSRIQDAPILELLLKGSDYYPYAEERRLFYVAMTRAKRKVILTTLKGKESCFVKELKSKYEKEMKREAFECPLCGAPLVRINGRYGDFYGCTNYRNSGCKYTRKVRQSLATK